MPLGDGHCFLHLLACYKNSNFTRCFFLRFTDGRHDIVMSQLFEKIACLHSLPTPASAAPAKTTAAGRKTSTIAPSSSSSATPVPASAPAGESTAAERPSSISKPWPIGASSACHQQQDHHHDGNDVERGCPVFAPGGSAGTAVLALGSGHHRLNSRAQAPGVVAGLESRLDLFLDDSLGCCVGKCSLQAIPDLYEHLAVLDEHEKNRAVILRFLPDPPRLGYPHCVIIDGRIRIHLRVNNHQDLIGGFTFELLQAPIQALRGLRPNNSGIIVEVTLRNRRYLLCRSSPIAQHERGNGGNEKPESERSRPPTSDHGHPLKRPA